MITFAFVMLIVSVRTLWMFWSATRAREIRWGYYALRDDLRFEAVKNPAIANSSDFFWIDHLATQHLRNLNAVSLWGMAMTSVLAKRRELELSSKERCEFERSSKRPTDPVLDEYRGRLGLLMFEWLRYKHAVLFLVLSPWVGDREKMVERAIFSAATSSPSLA